MSENGNGHHTTTALATVSQAGIELFRTSTDAASLCKDIVLATAVEIRKRKHVKVEGWQAIAIAHGCFASSGKVRRVKDAGASGYKATGYVKRAGTKEVIASAEGFVGDDEPEWKDKPVYARRAMAQTRAISRACRSAFAHVVVMMRAGLETTPAEEVPRGGFDHEEPKTLAEKLAPQVKAAENVRAAAQVLEGEIVEEDIPEDPVVPIGKFKDKRLSEIPGPSLTWLEKVYRERVNDPAKARYKKESEVFLRAVHARMEALGMHP